MMTTAETFVEIVQASGKYDLTAKVPEAVQNWRKVANIIVHTETGRFDTLAQQEAAFGGALWDYFRDPKNQDIVLQWDVRQWALLRPAYSTVLSLLVYRHDKAHGGTKYAPWRASVAPLHNIDSGKVVNVIGVHLPLMNNVLRKAVQTAVMKGLVKEILLIESRGEDWVLSADFNISWKNDSARLIELLGKPTGGTFAWEGRVPKTNRALIDGVLTNMPVLSSTLLPFDATVSDHQPVRVTLGTPTPPSEDTMPTSQNGYRANDRSLIKSFPIPGTTRSVSLREGAPGELLVDLASKFDKTVESVDGGILDDWGYAERPIRGSSTTLSNHASGTALDLNAPRHPLGKRGTFTAVQRKAIEALLAEYDGCIRWGGHYVNRADEMHFEIVASPEKCAATLKKIRGQKVEPVLNNVQLIRKECLAVLDKYGPRIPASRKVARAWVALVRKAVSGGPKE